MVLQRRELLDELGREQVGSRREHLTELGERRSQLLEGRAQPLGLTAARAAVLVGPAEQLLQAVLGHHRGDLRAPRHEVRLVSAGRPRSPGSPVPRRRRRRRTVLPSGASVLTMITVHRALWLMRFGTLPSRNSLRPGHPRVADDQHVDRLLLGGLHDRHGGVVVHHDLRAPALAGEPAGRSAGGRRGRAPRGCAPRPRTACPRVLGEHDLHDVEVRLRTGPRSWPPIARRARPSPTGRSPPSPGAPGRRSSRSRRASCYGIMAGAPGTGSCHRHGGRPPLVHSAHPPE